MKFLIFLISSCMATVCFAGYTEYCKGTQTTAVEDAVIQRLVLRFSVEMGCDIGDNCLLKWNVKDKQEKFSIAWKKQCGPVIKGIRQLGDEGHGSTFVCNFKNKNSICCWPLGYEKQPQCSPAGN